MDTVTHYFQQLSLYLAVSGLIALIGWGVVTKKNWFFVISAGSWLVHVIIFYSVTVWRFDNGITTLSPMITKWSAVIRFHAVTLVSGSSVILFFFAFFNRRENSWIHKLLS